MLRLQGMSLGSVPNISALNDFSCREMANLAGNAFSSAQASLAFVVGLQLLGKYLPANKSELKYLRQQLKILHVADKGIFSKAAKLSRRSEIFRKQMQVVLYMCVCVLIVCLHLIIAG